MTEKCHPTTVYSGTFPKKLFAGLAFLRSCVCTTQISLQGQILPNTRLFHKSSSHMVWADTWKCEQHPHLSTGCPEVLTPFVCERYTKKTHQTSLHLPINMLESSWRKVPSGKSSLHLRVSQPCNHQMAKTWQKRPKWNVDQQTDQQENCWEKNKTKSNQPNKPKPTFLNLLHSWIWGQNLQTEVEREFILGMY